MKAYVEYFAVTSAMRSLTREEAFDLRLKLTEALEDLLAPPVDVVILNSASLKMIHRIMTTGQGIDFGHNYLTPG